MGELGKREIDLQFDYSAARLAYPRDLDFYLKFLTNVRLNSTFRKFNHLSKLKTLNLDQKNAMKILNEAIKETLNGTNVIASIIGAAGSGKSTLLSSLCVQLDNYGIEYLVCAYTGSSASHFNAHTLFSLTGIYNCRLKSSEMISLPVHKTTKARLANVRVIVLEEAFLVGAKMFAMLFNRIAVIQGKTNVPSVSIFCFGDSSQLLPLYDVLLTSPIRPWQDNLTVEGLRLYQASKYKYELTTIVRQQFDLEFQGILTRIRNQETTEEDISRLEQRLEKNLSEKEQEFFKDIVTLYATTKECFQHTYNLLINSNFKVKRIYPVFSDNCSECETSFSEIYLACGLKIILTRNLIVARSLVNGSEGWIKNIYYAKDNLTLPKFVSIFFPRYTGPTLEDGTVPISVQEDRFYCVHLKKFIKYQYFPLQNASSKTVHRSQSFTFDHVVIDFSNFRFMDRRIYTSLSRCIRLDNVMLKSNRPLRCFFKSS